jgi:nicotinamidase-related amidase
MTASKSAWNVAAALCAAILTANCAATAGAETIIDTWTSTPVPPPPELQPVTIDSAHSALLILDMYQATCTEATRPRCVQTIPNVQHLLTEARAHKMLVLYTGGPPTSTTPTTPVDALKALPGEQTVRAGADKFVGSDLDKILANAGIKTVITVGTSADAAVLYTASGAALRNMTAVVPVDGIASVNPFGELYTVWHLKNTAATVSSHVIVTKSDMITFK